MHLVFIYLIYVIVITVKAEIYSTVVLFNRDNHFHELNLWFNKYETHIHSLGYATIRLRTCLTNQKCTFPSLVVYDENGELVKEYVKSTSANKITLQDNTLFYWIMDDALKKSMGNKLHKVDFHGALAAEFAHLLRTRDLFFYTVFPYIHNPNDIIDLKNWIRDKLYLNEISCIYSTDSKFGKDGELLEIINHKHQNKTVYYLIRKNKGHIITKSTNRISEIENLIREINS